MTEGEAGIIICSVILELVNIFAVLIGLGDNSFKTRRMFILAFFIPYSLGFVLINHIVISLVNGWRYLK